MARDSFNEQKNKNVYNTQKKKKKEEEKAVAKKPQSSSVKNVNKKASKSTFMGGTGNAEQKPKTVKKQPSAKPQQIGTNTTAAQRQKMGQPTTQDIQKAKQSRQQFVTRTSQAVKDATSEKNKSFMQRQKSGTLTAADKQKVEEKTRHRVEVAKNTGRAAKKGAQDAITGYRKTMADVSEMTQSTDRATYGQAAKLGIDKDKDASQWAKLEENRKKGYKQAREHRLDLQKKQDERQAEWDERTKDATGFEKALYGAAESGTGMLVDTGVGALTGTGQFGALASMGLRSYGTARGQAEKEGATEKEDRLYSLAQAGKEVATELMFQGAGLAKQAYSKGKVGLPLAEKAANALTKGLTGTKADVVGAGVKLLGGTAEENIEEFVGWGADPIIKELTYGRNVRNRMKDTLRSTIPQIGSDADAAQVASYFSTSKFTDDLTADYVKSGMSKEEASALAAEMRDYYVAYYSGDQEKLEQLEEDLAGKLSGQEKLSSKSWSKEELLDTFAATTLLTMSTGLPGAVKTSVKGNQAFDDPNSFLRQKFGENAVKLVADEVKNISDPQMSLRAETMKNRLDEGKDLTGTQKWDLMQGYQMKQNETAKKARASYGTVDKAMQEQKLVSTMGVDEQGNTVYAKNTQREYNKTYAENELTVEAVKNYLESDNSISDDEARRADAVNRAMTDLHVGGLTVGDAHEFGYGNTLAREALKASEGIDLDQYIVRNEDGTVNLPATNEATENALFQINADNAIRAAQAETEVYIDDTRGAIDRDILSRFGNNGQAVWKEVNKDLDPRDIRNYLTTANASEYFYSAGRNTDMSVEEAVNRFGDTFKTVDNSVLKRAFAAGARDRIIANTPGYGQTVEAGSNIKLKKTKPIITGQLIMDKDVVIPDSDQSAYLALAMSTNTNIHIVSSLKSKQGVEINGMSHGNDIYLNMNAAAESNLGYVFMHEMTHQIKQYAPNEYLALENLVRDRWFNKDQKGMQKAIKDRIDLYSTKGGQQLTEEEAVEEIIADAMAEAMDDPEFAAQVCEQDINLGQAILNSIKAALRSIRQMFANIENPNDRFHNSLLSYLGILDEAEKMWLNALHTARQNKADGLIADWKDRANKQSRYSITEIIGSNGESYGVGVKLDSTLLTGLNDSERIEMIKEFVNEIGGKSFIAVDPSGKNVEITIVDSTRFKNSKGKSIPANRDLKTKYNKNIVKQESIALADELIQVSSYENESVPLYSHGWLDNNGENNWEYWTTTVEDAEGNVWEATLNIATDSNGIKRLYDIGPIKKAERLVKSSTSSTKENITSSEDDVKFSLSAPVERVRDLIAVHNLKPDDIRNTFELGGFPMPSIAVTKDSMGHELYGDITLMFHSDTIDPKFFRSNQVFGGDAYTPTFPATQYKPNEDIVEKFRDIYYDNAKTLGYDAMRPFYELAEDAENALNKNGGEQGLIDRYKNDIRAMRTFLKMNGKDVEDVVKRTEDTISETEQKIRQYFIDTLGEDSLREFEGESIPHGKAMMEHRKNWTFEHSDEIKSIYRDFLNKEFSFSDEEISNVLDNMSLFETMKLVRNALNYLNDGATTVKEEVDRAATDKAIKDAAHELRYEEWIDGLLTGIEEKRGIRNNKEFFTRNGNRRSWDTLHDDITLENVVRVMRSELAAGGNGFLWKNPKGAAQKQYKSLDEIRADENRLQQLPEEEYKALEQAATQKLSDVLSDVVDNNPGRFMNPFGAVLDTGEYIAEILNETRDKDTMQRKLKKDYSLDVSDEQMDRIAEAIDEIANIPTGYFEAKPRRAVGFDEVRAAIIPNSLDADIREGLSERGVNIYEYDPEVEGDRTQKINDAASENDLRFSISNKYDDAYMDAVNSGNMEEAQRLVDEAAKEAGYEPVRMYHGTLSEPFTKFKNPSENEKMGMPLGFIYVTKDEGYAIGYSVYGEPFTEEYEEGFVLEGYINIKNTLNLGKNVDGFTYYNFNEDLENSKELQDKNATDEFRKVAKKVKMSPSELLEYCGFEFIPSSVWRVVNSEKYANLVREMGYDSIHTKEYGADSYGLLEPEQFKSADLVTYAEDGSVIPLSERFDPTNNDIRYSLPTQDSDGKILTDGQMEYFKNSQARDIFGRLVPVYHATDMGGFTIFDPWKSDDHRSLFFSNRRDVAKTYAYNGGNAFDFEPKQINDWNDLIRYGRQLFSDADMSWDDDTDDNNLDFELYDKASGNFADIGYDEWLSLVESNDPHADDYKVKIKLPYNNKDGETEYVSFEGDSAEDLLNKVSNGNIPHGGHYQVYLNLENPLIIEGDGQHWNDIVDGGSKIHSGAIVELRTAEAYDSDAKGKDDLYKIGQSWANGDNDRARAEEIRSFGGIEIGWKNSYDRKTYKLLVKPDIQSIADAINSVYDFDEGDDFGYSIAEELLPELKHSNITRIDSTDMRAMIGEYGYNTREWAEFAEDEGHDGVIFRNIVDINDKSDIDEAYAASDVYVAFSSNQVKDFNNENPTENPDIRYSITEEDEAMEWLASQYELDDVPLDDEQAEEGRIRMAKSKKEFISSKNVLWNERWLTEGKIINVKSARKNIRDLVTGVMANSDTDHKYKSEVVDKTLIDAKSAYWLMKEGKHSEAAELLWNSAVRMIENVDFIEDTTFKQYKDLRDYMRTTSFKLGEEYWSDVDFSAFRKRNFGRIKLVKGETNIDEIYKELQERWGEWFDEDEQMTAPDQLLRIEEVLDAIQPYKIAYSSEEAEQLAGDIADTLYDIVYQGEEYKSIADTFKERYDAKTKALKARHEEALAKVRTRRDELLAAEKEKTSRQKERAELWKSRTFEEKAKRQKDKDVRKKAKYFGKISDNIDWLTTRLLNETKDKNIPEGFRKSLAHMLMQFDMQTEKSKALEEKFGPAKKTLQMRELKSRLEKIANEDDTGEFRYDGYLFYLMDALAEKVDGQTIDSLDTEDLIAIDTMLKSIVHNFRNYNKIRLEEEKVAIANVGDNTIESMDERIKKYGKRKAYKGARGLLDKLVNEGEETPIYFFERLDPTGNGIGAMYKELRRGEDRHIRNMNFLRNRFKEMFSEYANKNKAGSKLEEWRDTSQAQTFNLENGPITLNPAQIMSLYCLSKRPQAMGHILGAGIVASPISFGAKMNEKFKGNEEQVDSVMIKYSELQEIIATLTEDQVKLADEMQALMNNEMAAWGNETSLELHGIKLFRETDYFPIKSSNEELQKSADKRDVQEKIKNFGFTKPLVRNANNAIMIDDIFSVVADHCNKMSLYNSMAIPITDFMRVYNYKQRREGEKPRTVQAVIGEAFTRKANEYITKFISDVNGNTKTRSDAVDDLMNKALANYKKASIGFNARVALQQPTAVFRALMAIDAKYFVGTRLVSPKDQKEMFEHCPIALWKSWGHYDMDMGRDIEDIMMNNDHSLFDTVTMGGYGMLDNMAWGKIWQAVKNEIKDKHPNVKVGSNAFYRLCNERASEVFDKTQVVDSIFHRSDIMRSKNTLTKMTTSFMAEPTLTYNVFRDSLVKAHELRKDGNKGEANKLLLKMGIVTTLNALAVSGAAALWDAVRGKGADDDDDDENLMEKGLMKLVTALGGTDPWTKEEKSGKDLWLINFINNFADNAPWAQWNNIYFVKDIVGLKDGWGTSNMALEGWETLFKGFSQTYKKLTEGSDKSWYDIFMNIAGGTGYLVGWPIKTFLRDAKALAEKAGVEVFATDGSEKEESTDLLEILANKLGYQKAGSSSDSIASKKTSKESKGKNKAEGVSQSSAISDTDMSKLSSKAAEKAEGLTGRMRDEMLWDVVSDGYTKYIAAGDFASINKLRTAFEENGGDTKWFDDKVTEACKKAYKKSIVNSEENSDLIERLNMQEDIRNYMLDHGVSETELSDICYHSNTSKDLKAALRLGNSEYIIDELVPLVQAGLSYDDFVRLYENRNRGAKDYNGKYTDPKYTKTTGTFVWPTQGTITSHFGYRNAPTRGASSNHPAIDIGAPKGTPVVAADGGVVIYAGSNGGYGNSVGVRHANGMVTYYNHLSAWNVKVGDQVGQGQQIAAVGSTGISTGPHLDFKILDADGSPVDPEKYLN